MNKLYSKRAILISTFIASPLIASIMIRNNLNISGLKKQGNIVLLLGGIYTIILTLLIFVFSIEIFNITSFLLISLSSITTVFYILNKFQKKSILYENKKGIKLFSIWKIIGLNLLVLLLVIPIFSSTYLYSIIDIDDKIDYSKYDMFVTAKELSEFYKIQLDTSGKSESCQLWNFSDGSFEIKYTYNHPDLFYSIDIERELNKNEAIDDFILTKNTFLKANKIRGFGIREIDSIKFSFNQSYYAYRIKNDSPHGVFFTVRKNNVIYTLIMSGFYSSDQSLIHSLILPKIKNLEDFRIIE